MRRKKFYQQNPIEASYDLYRTVFLFDSLSLEKIEDINF